MFGIAIFATLALAVSSVSGAVVPRRNPPKGWLFNLLEPYQTYHTRYLALDCQNQHNTDFFTQCCHPMLANQTLSSRPAQCTPTDVASSSAAAAEPSSTVSTPVTPSPAAAPATNNDEDDDGDDDCDDGDDGDDPAPVTPAATPAASSSATETSSSSDSASSTSSSSSSDPSPTAVSGNAEAPPPAPPAPSSSSSSSSDPAPTSSSDPAPPAPSPSQSSGDSGSDAGGPFDPSVVHTGGFGTFYTQDGAPGACGQVHQDSDLIVAMNIATYGDGSNNAPICGKQVHITNNQNGKSVTATVADACPGCRNNESIDLSTGTFNTIADPATGVIPITWQYLP